MRDEKVSLPRVMTLHPAIAKEVEDGINYIEQIYFPSSIAIRVVQAERTIDYQNQLFHQPHDGKDNDGDGHIDEADEKVTNAPGGSSFHNFKLAWDFALLYDLNGDGKFETLSWNLVKDLDRDGQADWMEVVNYFKKIGWEWGGDWSKKNRDNPHLQKTFGFTVKELYARFKAKRFIPGTDSLDLSK